MRSKWQTKNIRAAEAGFAPAHMDAGTIAAIVSHSVTQALPRVQPRVPQVQVQRARKTLVHVQEEKTKWSLRKMLCPEKLAIHMFTRQKFKAWESAFQLFIREANLSDKSLEKKSTAFQTACEAETFKNANSLRLQKLPGVQEDLSIHDDTETASRSHKTNMGCQT